MTVITSSQIRHTASLLEVDAQQDKIASHNHR